MRPWLLALSLAASLCACGDNPSPPASQSEPAPDASDDGGNHAQEDVPVDAPADAPVDVPADVPVDAPVGWVHPSRWVVHVSPEAPAPVQQSADDLVAYLGRMGLEAAREDQQGAVVCEDGVGRLVLVGDGLDGPALAEGATDQTWSLKEERCGAGALLHLGGGGLRGRQYAAYDLLHRWGVRFYHPEQEYVPRAPAWNEAPLDLTFTPHFRDRSVSLHLTHPLELGDPYRLGDDSKLDEVRRYIDWEIKNLASLGHDGPSTLSGYGLARGFPRHAGFSLHNQQQGGNAIIDADDPRPDEVQIAEAIEEQLSGEPKPAYFQFTYGPSEFTELDDQLTVRHLTFIADYMAEHHPDVILRTINHGTAGEPTAHYGERYYSLSRFAPDNLGVQVHTLMFYDLFRPAPVYGNENFNYLFDFMVDLYRERDLWYFPESAWWLTFDIAIPLYLPITLDARARDIQGIKFMLDGRLRGHHVFGSGHEWGYWQNEYCSFRMAANTDSTLQDCLKDLATPMGEAAPQVVEALQRVIDWQTRDILYGELVRYLVGTDPETEIAAQAGIVFHPLPPAVPEILQWDAAAVEQWQRRIAPNLEQMDRDYASLTASLRALRPSIPEDGLPWFDEILDGIEVTGLRARHALHVYGSLVLLRQSRLTGDPALQEEARRWLDAAHADTEAALEVVHRREQGYRYRPLERSIAGGPEGDQDENWTVYRFRYLNRTHHAFYYTRIDNLAEEAFAGADAPYLVADALLAPGEALTFQLLDPTLTEPTLNLGDGATSSERVVTHTYEAPGVYDLTLTATQGEAPLDPPLTFSVAALTGELLDGLLGPHRRARRGRADHPALARPRPGAPRRRNLGAGL